MKKVLQILSAAILGLSGVAAYAQQVPQLHISERTLLIDSYVDYHDLGPESDGIIAVYADGSYTFIDLMEPNIISEVEWQALKSTYDAEAPQFNRNICAVRHPDNNRFAILYRDSKYILLPENIIDMSPFKDGLAMVAEEKGDEQILYYINKAGNTIYPHLRESISIYNYSNCQAREISCGLRAHYSNKDHAWGFIDTDGRVVIEPKFEEVRDFVNDYAVVKMKEDFGPVAIIDKAGNVVCTVFDSSLNLPGVDQISNVSPSGLYSVSGFGAKIEYYSIAQKKKVYQADRGTHLVGGHTFILDGNVSNIPGVYNEQFQRVGSWEKDYVNMYMFNANYPPINFIVLNDRIVVDCFGNLFMTVPDDYAYKLGAFSKNGIAPVKGLHRMNQAEFNYTGYCGITGEVLIAFYNPDDIKQITLDYLNIYDYKTYFMLGDPFSFDGRVIASYSNDTYANVTDKATFSGYNMGVEGEQTVTVEYMGLKRTYSIYVDKPYQEETVVGGGGGKRRIPEDPEEVKPQKDPGKVGYKGNFMLKVEGLCEMEVPLWLEFKDENSSFPYGNGIKGYLTAAFNPSDEFCIKVPTGESTISMQFFMAPMAVYDIKRDSSTGKTYLILGGGQFEICNVDVRPTDPNRKLSRDEEFILDRIHSVHEYDGCYLGDGLYRLEIRNGSIESGSFTFGTMERFSYMSNRWTNVYDPEFDEGEDIVTYIVSFTEIGKFLLMGKKDIRVYEEVFNNQKMTKVIGRPDIYWYPTASFYPDYSTQEDVIQGAHNLEEQYQNHQRN